MTPTMNQLYATGVALARQLGLPVEEVPQPFQLNELEDYVAQKRQIVANHTEELNAELPPVEKPNGSTDKR